MRSSEAAFRSRSLRSSASAVPRRRMTRSAQALDTRERLVQAARRLFAREGYHATGTHEIVDEAKITRGALCHHFPRKKDLFVAVFEEVRRGWIVDATKETHEAENKWERLRRHMKSFLHSAVAPDVHRIVMIDGPAVLGWKAWREIQALDGLSLIVEAIQDGIAFHTIKPQAPESLAYLIVALIEESALLVSYAENQREAVMRAEYALDTLLCNMR
jgi:AcrR family transcriptional regulator